MTRQFKFNRTLYRWRHPRQDWELWLGSNIVATVERDQHYPRMFRIYRSGHPPSDMVNLSRAKDAAVALVDRDLECRRCAPEAPPIDLNAEAATTLPERVSHD